MMGRKSAETAPMPTTMKSSTLATSAGVLGAEEIARVRGVRGGERGERGGGGELLLARHLGAAGDSCERG